MLADPQVVTLQIGRAPRDPWRVAVRCSHGYPQVLASPSRLGDGTPFPTTFWLTCPHLVQIAGHEESHGALAEYDRTVDSDPEFAESLRAAHDRMQVLRAEETQGSDACPGAGVAGQADPLIAKCLHARVAAALAGVADPIGLDLLGRSGRECEGATCDSLR